MYLDYVVDIPDVKGKITFRTKGQARYVYYEYSREYDPSKQYTNVKRVTIGKILPEDENKMRPNENFRKYFPEVEQPEEKTVSCRSSCLKTGAYMIIDKAAKDLELDTKLQDSFGAKAAGIMLDLAAYSIITEGNAAQYYPDYAYNHPLFTPDMKCYSDSFISDFLRSIKEDQRQDFLDQWNADRCKRERIYISYDSTNKNCQAGDIDIVEFGAAKVDAGLPIFNYAVGYDVNNREPLMYEKYSGSINDVSQLQFMVDKIKGYGYKNIGFILDRGYFSKDNLSYMDNSGFSFIIMVKGIKDFISSQVRKLKALLKTTGEIGSRNSKCMEKQSILLCIPVTQRNDTYIFITVLPKRLANVQDWKKKSMKCRDLWNCMKIMSMNSDRHSISIFICIITRKTDILFMANPGCR